MFEYYWMAQRTLLKLYNIDSDTLFECLMKIALWYTACLKLIFY